MKRGKLRHIVVDGKTFRWNYFYDDMDFVNYPYSYYSHTSHTKNRHIIGSYATLGI